jgi:sporulation protein YlmC with PRC-barrel domain
MTSKARPLVSSSRVKGSVVYDAAGASIGHVHDLSIDKASGRVLYALVGHGGFLGVGNRFHPIPWEMLHYDVAMDGYIAPLYRSELNSAPSYTHHELPAFGVRPVLQA